MPNLKPNWKRAEAVAYKRAERKRWAIKYLGGKCQICGYDKCNAALAFHHRDQLQKEFEIGGCGLEASLERLKAELDKCDLVCCRCHIEIHHGDNSLGRKASPCEGEDADASSVYLPNL